MPQGMPTLLDAAVLRNDPVVEGLIEENQLLVPEFQLFPVRELGVGITAYHTMVRTGIPDAHFRNINEGVPRSKSAFEKRLAECFVIDSPVAADSALADQWPGGRAAYQTIEASGVFEGTMRRIAKQTYYGNSAAAVAKGLGEKKGFPGLIDAYDTGEEIDAGGAVGANRTSVWAVKLGIKDVHFTLGGGTVIALPPDWRKETMYDENNNPFTAYVNNLQGWIGLQVGSENSVRRIRNLTDEVDVDGVLTHGMNDTLGQEALESFPSGVVPDFFLMTRRSRRQLRVSRQAVVAVIGKSVGDVPIPTDIEGIPIVITEAISNDEGAL